MTRPPSSGVMSPAATAASTDEDATWTVDADWVSVALEAGGGVRPHRVFLSAGTLEPRFVTSVEQQSALFSAGGVPVRSYISPGTGHEWGTWRRSLQELEDACGQVEQAAHRAFLELRRLYGQQDEAFTFTLPLARGLR